MDRLRSGNADPSLARPLVALGTTFQNPVLLGAGSCGFGRELEHMVDIESLGGIVTKSVTSTPRSGNPAPRITEWRTAMINSVGLANPGLAKVREEHLPWMARNLSRPRVLISAAGRRAREYAEVVGGLDQEDGFLGFELNLSCPNALARGGATFAHDPDSLFGVVELCRLTTSRPLVAKLAPALPDLAGSLKAAQEAGADAVTLLNSLPASGPGAGASAARLGAGAGALSGPPLRPHVLEALRAARTGLRIPVMASGGVATSRDAIRYLRAGASLIQMCTAVFADPLAPAATIRGLGGWPPSGEAGTNGTAGT